MGWSKDNARHTKAMGDFAQAQGDYAQAQGDFAQQVAADNETIWLPEVSTVALRDSTYPTPAKGNTVRITEEARIDRFNGQTWITTDRYNPNAIDLVSQQLAEKAAKSDVDNALISKRDKAIPIGLNDADAELLGAIQNKTGETTFNLLSEPRPGSVTPEKTTFLTDVYGTNLFDKTAVTLGGYYDGTSLAWASLNTVGQSAFINVKPGDTIRLLDARTSGSVNIVYKNIAETIFAGTKIPSTGGVLEVIVPANAVQLSVTFMQNAINTYMIVKNEAYPSSYISYTKSLSLGVDLKNAILGLPLKPPENSVTPKQTTFIKEVEPVNLFNKSKTTAGGYYDSSTLAWNNLASVSQSEFIPVTQGDILNIRNDRLIGGSHYVLKNTAGNIFTGAYLSNASGGFSIAIPPGVSSFSISVYNENIDTFMIVKNAQLPNVYIPYIEPYLSFDEAFKKAVQKETHISNNPWFGKRVAFTGDSITWGYSPINGSQILNNFAKQTSEKLGMTFINYGISSSTIAAKESEPATRTPVVNRFNEMDNTVDLVIVAIGTNDFQYNWTPLGTMDSRSNFDYYGALHNLCLGLLDKYKSKQILFMTPIKRAQSPYLSPASVNANGKTLKEYGQIIKEVCNYYSIPVLDMYSESLINPHIESQKNEYINDGTHPNEKGHTLLANRLSGYLRQLA